MARAVKSKDQKLIEAVLWRACDKLRGSIDPGEYKYGILSLIFLKYANDKFDEQRERMIANDHVEVITILPRDMFYIISNLYTVENLGGIRYELAA